MKLVSILDGNTFLVSDEIGDIDFSEKYPMGLFSYDTRFLSRWVLTINGSRLQSLSVDETQYFESRFFLVPEGLTHYVDSKMSVIRERRIGGSFEEDLSILNHSKGPLVLDVRINIGSDFADIFEVKNLRPKVGRVTTETHDDRLVLTYERGSFRRSTTIHSSVPGTFDRTGISFHLHVLPHERWSTRLTVISTLREAPGRRGASLQEHVQKTGVHMRENLAAWMDSAPTLASAYEPVVEAYRRSLVDLAALRYTPLGRTDQIPAAGLPWFMALFGRDTMFTCLQAMPFKPELTPPTLAMMVRGQGSHLDDFRDEEPGKILHEGRWGESATFEEQPHSPYFGAADSTPLFVILLDEYERWSGDKETANRLEYEARAALTWIDTYADLLGTGYIWYERRNTTTGLENQCWKDSWDSVAFADGTLPDFPRATCELQGYAYDAKRRGARLAREVWNDPEYALRLEREAEELKRRFNRDFWIEDGQYYALALDPHGRQVDALSSNIGHLLWSGIVDEDRAPSVARHLMGTRLFSGWGVRTLATGHQSYNPIGYHVGTVWPFDNSIIAWGLRRYGFKREAAAIAKAIIDAAPFFRGRLPEAFAGYERSLTTYPVEYPTACSPQAWSAGAPLLLIRAILGMEPDGEVLTVDPLLPPGFGSLELRGVPGRWGRVDVRA
ncbi:glycogen debranching N-terminal domain-containing protein [Micromonospora sp. NPDC051141]|uniref:amylo-alpha-1,6-glucosidase n=1 Tax=Micromonospora sp. NPDC051141 TaxID=3364284 RepID=UPI0037979DD5